MNPKCQWKTLVSEFDSSSNTEKICEDQIMQLINLTNKQGYTFDSS